MYTKRVQIINYGPIGQLDMVFPFDQDSPKPVVLVGENGSGKSILLSHIVNGLVDAKGRAYPDTPEVEPGKVFKLRSPFYVGPHNYWSYSKVDFEHGLYISELNASQTKQHLEDTAPNFPSDDVKQAWNAMHPESATHLNSNFDDRTVSELRDIFTNNSVLFFPHNRFEEPAWLNQENLMAEAHHMSVKHLENQTSRRVINYSSLTDNQNWLFDVAYDRAVFEVHTVNLPFQPEGINQSVDIPIWAGYSGNSTSVYGVVSDVIRQVVRADPEVELRIGRRLNRVLSLWSGGVRIVPNIFQLSSGETSLLNLFLTVLRDFELSGTTISTAEEVRGTVVVDEVDLHLHAIHQYEVLPSMMKMFPNVQFVVTSHSPLFVLGLNRVFGEDGFALYRLPDGQQISPEEFSEFEQAYRSFSLSERFDSDIRQAIVRSQDPLVFMEGITDVKYVQKAAEHLGYEPLLSALNLDQAGSSSNLSKIWNTMRVATLTTQRMLLIYDSDTKMPFEHSGEASRCSLPFFDAHPVKKGIENLFARETLERARSQKAALIDTASEQKKTVRGEEIVVPETWSINKSEKTNLCNWLCENGTAEDFQYFKVIFNLLSELLEYEPAT